MVWINLVFKETLLESTTTGFPAKFLETKLPPKEAFYNQLNKEHVVEMPGICHTQWDLEVEYSSIFIFVVTWGYTDTEST